MNCPVCDKPMLTFELDQVEVDHCPVCGGIWLDAGELELLLGDPVKASSLIASFHPAAIAEKPRSCPICLGKMEKVHLAPERSPIVLDRCRRRHGIWFDRDELPGVIKARSFDPEHKIEKLLADVFGPQHEGEST
jgi:Zn-finger nucleic acid-binding protein